jgi:hypothetical protein
MATMYEKLCGNSVGRIELTIRYPHKFSYIVAILIHNHFELSNRKTDENHKQNN